MYYYICVYVTLYGVKKIVSKVTPDDIKPSILATGLSEILPGPYTGWSL